MRISANLILNKFTFNRVGLGLLVLGSFFLAMCADDNMKFSKAADAKKAHADATAKGSADKSDSEKNNGDDKKAKDGDSADDHDLAGPILDCSFNGVFTIFDYGPDRFNVDPRNYQFHDLSGGYFVGIKDFEFPSDATQISVRLTGINFAGRIAMFGSISLTKLEGYSLMNGSYANTYPTGPWIMDSPLNVEADVSSHFKAGKTPIIGKVTVYSEDVLGPQKQSTSFLRIKLKGTYKSTVCKTSVD